MTHFEYVAAAHTLILTFAAARILGGVANALQPRRLYWVHLSWVGLAVLFCLTSFWVFWGYREVEWTLPRLILLLEGPGLIYVFSSMVIPADSAAVESWREYFFASRARVFVGGAIMIVSVIVSNQALAGASALDPTQVPLYLLFGVFVVGSIFDAPRLHSILGLVPPLFAVGLLLSRVAQPDGITP